MPNQITTLLSLMTNILNRSKLSYQKFIFIFISHLRLSISLYSISEHLGKYMLLGKSVLPLLLVNFVTGFRLELMSHRKYQVKPHSSPWFSAAYAPAIVHRNHFFHLYQKDNSSESKLKFRQASNRCKMVLEAAKLAYANKTKESITSHKPGSQDFW